MGEIATASAEQATGIDQVNRAVVQMDSAVQANAAHTDELSSTAQALAAQAEELHALVGRFKLEDVRNAAAPAPVAPSHRLIAAGATRSAGLRSRAVRHDAAVVIGYATNGAHGVVVDHRSESGSFMDDWPRAFERIGMRDTPGS